MKLKKDKATISTLPGALFSTPGALLKSTATLLAFVLSALVPAHATHPRRGPTAHIARPSNAGKNQKHKSPKSTSKTVKGQRQISSDRATEIQGALIKAGYLQGEPTGQWDADTTAALQKLQADNGWQTKITPDSRALIKLGLGPNESSTAATSSVVNAPAAAALPGAAERTSASGSSAAAGESAAHASAYSANTLHASSVN